jgi:hypothetical protein
MSNVYNVSINCLAISDLTLTVGYLQVDKVGMCIM